MSGFPATGTSGLGIVSVRGRMRSPRPAANTIAFMVRYSCGCNLRSDTRIRVRQLRNDTMLQKPRELSELRVPSASVTYVLECQRKVTQVAGLAIPIPQPRKDPEHFDMPLHADEIEPAQKLA